MSESNKNERVAAEDVRRVAELAYLELTGDEEVHMKRDLNAILDYIAQLNELDTSQIEPMAPETDGTFFKVPKVIER